MQFSTIKTNLHPYYTNLQWNCGKYIGANDDATLTVSNIDYKVINSKEINQLLRSAFGRIPGNNGVYGGDSCMVHAYLSGKSVFINDIIVTYRDNIYVFTQKE